MRPERKKGGEQFLLTPLREGRQLGPQFWITEQKFLLTPLREGRHFVTLTLDQSKIISTHAPAGGATREARTEEGR